MLFLLKTENLLYFEIVLIEILTDLILSIAMYISFTNKKSKFIENLPNTVVN